MENDDLEYDSLRTQNRIDISLNKDCQKVIYEMREVERFLSDFCFLSFGRNTILCDARVFSLQTVLISAQFTVGSIISCCESACLADANTLLRKYRDDLFFYLYVVVYEAYAELQEVEKTRKMQKNIKLWLQDELRNLDISEIMKTIGKSPQASGAVKIYNMQSSFDELGKRLNNFVHGNGMSFYNKTFGGYSKKELLSYLNAIQEDMQIITTSFLFLLTLCSPYSISGTDYEDFLDCNMVPPDGCQYLPAPFVQKFLKKNQNLIGKSCMEYLRDKTLMQFE